METGYLQIADTLTQAIQGVLRQKNYEVKNLADFVNFDFVGTNMNALIRGRTRSHSERHVGFRNGTQGFAKAPSTTVSRDMYSINNHFWLERIDWSKRELDQASAGLIPFDVLTEKVDALKKSWDLEVQESVFAGVNFGDVQIAGLLDIDGITVNNTIIPNGKTITTLTQDQMYNFVATVLAAYAENSNISALPDRFVVPLADYLGWSVPFAAAPTSGVSAGITMNTTILDYLENAFKKVTQNPGFKILPIKYAEAATMKKLTGRNVNIYALYQKEDDALKFHIPQELQSSPIVQTTGTTFTMDMYGEIAGISCGRPENILYLESGVV